MTNKRFAQAIATSSAKKAKINMIDNANVNENDDDFQASHSNANDDSKSIKCDDRFKNFATSNVVVSVKDNMFAKTQSKKLSKQTTIKRMFVFMKNFTTDHDQIMFLNNHSKKSVMTFYRKSEKIESMIHF